MTISRRDFVLGASALVAGAGFAPAAIARSKPLTDILSWDRLTDHTQAVVNLALGGNSLAIASGDEVLVVDSKFTYLGPALREDAMKLGQSVSLLNTHHHGDHTGGNNAFVGKGSSYAHPNAISRIKTMAELYMGDAQGAVMRAKRDLDGNERAMELAMQVAENAQSQKVDDFVPTNPVDHGDTIRIGELELDIHHFGSGHTDNDIVVQLKSENIIHTGDLVFAGLHPFYLPAGGATAKGWIESLEQVLKLCDDETVVVPGHGAVGGKEVVENMKSYHEQLVDVVQGEINKGTSKEDAQQMSWPFMDGLQFEQIKGRASGAVYDELNG